MALITRTINNTGAPLTDVNGAVLALTPIRFTLVNSRSYAAGTFDATTGEPVAPGPYLAATDEDGLFSVDLWPTSRGLEERFYLVEIAPDSDTVEFQAFKSPLADGAGDLPFLSFRLGGDTVEEWELDAFTAHVNNMDLHTPSGTGHTHDNKAILDQISESVGKLTYNGSLVGISDHGGMTGLSDDDHTQYLNSTRHSAITGNPHSTTPADIGAATAAHTHAGVYEPANANIQGHINSIANPHSVTAAQVGIANKSALDKITESSGLPLWNGTAWPGGSAGGGDMYKSAYDTDNDGIVDAAESAPWAGITGKPSTYPPESHTHDDRYYTESEVNSLLGGKSDTTHNHSGVYQSVMGADDNYVTDAEKAALHSHSNKTALDAVSGTNTGDQDLSGYSLTSHNHSLNSLTEKSYNSLTDKPSIPSIAGLLDETAHDLLDHTGLAGIPAAYTLPTASTTVLGGVKVDGTTVTITDGVISSSGPGMTNPMTAAGDIIYGGTSGAPTRLAKGTDGQVLTLESGLPAWAAASGGSAVIDWANPVPVTTTATLTIGKHHVCSGTSSDYTVTLPAVSGNAGKLISVEMSGALTKLVTVDGNASETIDGATTRIMWARETAVLLCDGTQWTKVGGKSIPMNTSLYLGANQSCGNAGYTLIAFDTLLNAPLPATYNLTDKKINIVRQGLYALSLFISLDASSGGYKYYEIYVNNVQKKFMLQDVPSGKYIRLDTMGFYNLTAGDYVTAKFYTSVGTQTLLGADVAVSQLSAKEEITW